ncbi:MAG TPA: DUF4340 domain-containing protein [Clostridiales bacterium]|nr:DUF4340 domain-containing protein [Clostridiales bacterium]
MSNLPEQDRPKMEPDTPEQPGNQLDSLINEDGEDLNSEFQNSTIFSKPVYKDKRPATNKTVRNIIVSFAVLVVLVAALFLVVKFIPDAGDDASSDTVGQILLTEVSVDDISRITIKNVYDNFILYPEQDSQASDTGRDWYIEGVDKNLIDTYSTLSTVQRAAKVYAVRTMGETDADYGLDNPLTVINVECIDSQNSYTLSIGNVAPDNSGSYAKISTDDKVYLLDTSTVGNFNVDRTHFADINMVSPIEKTDANSQYFDVNNKLVKFDYVTFEGTNFPQRMKFIPNPYNTMVPYFLVEPVKQNVTEETFSNVLSVVASGLIADGAYVLHPTADQIKEYKLDKPEAVITFKVGEQTVVIKASKAENSYYAAMVNDVPVIYKLSTSSLGFAESKPVDFFSPVVLMEDITTVDNLRVKSGNQDITFKLTHKTADDSTSILEVRSGDIPVNADQFRNFYLHLLTISPMEFKTEPPSGEHVATITVTLTDTSREPIVLDFYRYSDRRYLITTNGNTLGLVTSAKIDKILTYAQNLINGLEVPDPTMTAD